MAQQAVCLHQQRMRLREPTGGSVWRGKDLNQVPLVRRTLEPSQKYGWGGEVVGLDSTQLWGPCDDPLGAARAPEHQGLQTSREGSAGPGWGPSAGPWARGAPTSGRQQREAAEQQQRQRDEARRHGALHGAGGLRRRTKARRAAATRSSQAWAANARLLRAAFNYPARRRRGGGGARGDPPSNTAQLEHAATQTLLPGCRQSAKL